MTGKELTGSIAKGGVGGIFALYGGILLAHCFFCCCYQEIE